MENVYEKAVNYFSEYFRKTWSPEDIRNLWNRTIHEDWSDFEGNILSEMIKYLYYHACTADHNAMLREMRKEWPGLTSLRIYGIAIKAYNKAYAGEDVPRLHCGSLKATVGRSDNLGVDNNVTPML